MSNKKQRYFDSIASERSKQRKAKKYYWNDITKQCNFFIHPDYSVLEVGCGTGELLNEINCSDKTGIDFSEKMVAVALAQFPNLNIVKMDAENISLNQKFDVIILSNLVGYLDDIEKVFNQLHSVCHPHTKIIINYYNYLWEPILKFGEWIGYKTKTPNQNWLSITEINSLLFYSGFQVYRNSKSMLLPVYLPLVSEVFNEILAKLPLFRNFCINQYAFATPHFNIDKVEKDYTVSVIVPARNEAGNIENLIKRLPKLGKQTELIFVESGSVDSTWNKILDAKAQNSQIDIKVIQLNENGKAAAVNAGFDLATGDVLMILDADLTVAPEDLPKFYDAIARNKGDFIYGSRLVYQMEKEAMRFLNLIGNKFFSLLFTWLLDQRFKDTLCGTKVLFKKDYLRLKQNRNYFGNFDPFGDFDLLFGAYKLNLCMVELPVKYHERTYGRTNISRFKHGFLLLRMCFFAARKIKFKK
jgi:SAM-dependent methyltransferase